MRLHICWDWRQFVLVISIPRAIAHRCGLLETLERVLPVSLQLLQLSSVLCVSSFTFLCFSHWLSSSFWWKWWSWLKKAEHSACFSIYAVLGLKTEINKTVKYIKAFLSLKFPGIEPCFIYIFIKIRGRGKHMHCIALFKKRKWLYSKDCPLWNEKGVLTRVVWIWRTLLSPDWKYA